MASDRERVIDLALNQILVVEDSKDIQYLLTRVLEAAGYSVSCASDGREALELMRSSQTIPDLIILDIMMPRMDGFQFRQEQEKDARLSAIPILAMTAWADVQTKAMQLGAKGYLKKPFSDIPTILAAVSKFFPAKKL